MSFDHMLVLPMSVSKRPSSGSSSLNTSILVDAGKQEKHPRGGPPNLGFESIEQTMDFDQMKLFRVLLNGKFPVLPPSSWRITRHTVTDVLLQMRTQ